MAVNVTGWGTTEIQSTWVTTLACSKK